MGLNALYTRSPVAVQNICWSLKGLAYRMVKQGPLFRKLLRGLEEAQYAAEETRREYQDRKLKALVAHCHAHVPYYQELFARLRLRPADIAGRQDLAKLPFTTKEDIRKAPAKFLSRTARRVFLRQARTSGTTGTPLVLYRDRFSAVFENAMIWRFYRWAGVNPGDRIAALRGGLIQAVDDMRGPFWRQDAFMNRLILSAYHIHPRSAPEYAKALRQFKPAAIEAYPSAVYSLVRHLAATGEEGIELKAVFTSSETLYGYQRRAVEEFFGCRVFDLYGSAERVCAAGSCEYGRYHLFNDYGITEFLEAGGDNPPGTVEIIATGLHNLAMPILRYRTQDRAVPGDRKPPCPCGRTFPSMERFESYRADDYLLTADGRRLQSVEQMVEGLEDVLEYQVLQESPARVRIRVVAGRPLGPEDEERILRKARERLGGAMRMKVEQVDAIARTPNGKYPFIVNTWRRARGGAP